MNDEKVAGQRFSLIYLRSDELSADTVRMRRRLATIFSRTLEGHSTEVGKFLEAELGIGVLRPATSYLHWMDLLKWELRDVLDAITLIGAFIFKRLGPIRLQRYFDDVSRIFAEENASYRLDDQGGIHPAVDSAYQVNIDSAVRHLGARNFESARGYLAKADDELLPAGNNREAIRAIFDAVENIFKQMFQNAQSINGAGIRNDLKPHVQRLYADGAEARAALKNVDALSNWVDACHNYRHDPGHADPIPPSDELAVLIVSQGIGYVRWLAGLMVKQ